MDSTIPENAFSGSAEQRPGRYAGITMRPVILRSLSMSVTSQGLAIEGGGAALEQGMACEKRRLGRRGRGMLAGIWSKHDRKPQNQNKNQKSRVCNVSYN
jgi:hypothetical protein